MFIISSIDFPIANSTHFEEMIRVYDKLKNIYNTFIVDHKKTNRDRAFVFSNLPHPGWALIFICNFFIIISNPAKKISSFMPSAINLAISIPQGSA